ncbi:MAG TPA: deoxyribodipyrimidine photo-lyase [Patescibacteria group bacterium]|jgi:deoxyribodipyrimidine photo-lyase|nr:deoxyribodipyrimidine photo-lyase [Patescibacteria group bacterium]
MRMSSKQFTRSICIFRRDLRLKDHTALHAALKSSAEVMPVFFFDPRQVGNENAYRSECAIQFMIESLADLDQQLDTKNGKLFCFYGTPEDLLVKLCSKYAIDAVFFNEDYTLFALNRDQAIKDICKKIKISCYTFHDALLCNPYIIKTKQGSSYAMFTPFYKTASTYPVKKPTELLEGTFFKYPVSEALNEKKIRAFVEKKYQKKIPTHGGSFQAKNLLSHLHTLKEYARTHDIPSFDTSLLSAHLKFGTVSVRQVYYTVAKNLGSSHPLIRQLYWRDFFSYTALHHPEMFGSCLRSVYNNLQWTNDKAKFKQWQTGTTGFPIVDAGMRQLNNTGFMHNRVRMIVASFLTKDLHIDWQWGEKYFAQQLVDYDPAVNNGNWQWAASVGIDAQPYFRIFNPWLGQKKFDPECLYIKLWVPELKNVPATAIHYWFKEHKKYTSIDYPAPLVDHKCQREKTLILYKKIKNDILKNKY